MLWLWHVSAELKEIYCVHAQRQYSMGYHISRELLHDSGKNSHDYDAICHIFLLNGTIYNM